MSQDKPKKSDDGLLWYLRSIDQSGGTTTCERTEFGEHIDHMNAFYGSLTPDQKESFVDPLAVGNDQDSFENSLTLGQKEFWDIIKLEAKNLGGYAIPNNDINDADLALSGLRTMLDFGLSDDPEVRAIQEQTIEQLGGIDAASKLAEESLNPDFELDSVTASLLIEIQNGEHSYVESKPTLIEHFVDGKPFEIVGSANGGILPVNMTQNSEELVVESPSIQITPLGPDGQ